MSHALQSVQMSGILDLTRLFSTFARGLFIAADRPVVDLPKQGREEIFADLAHRLAVTGCKIVSAPPTGDSSPAMFVKFTYEPEDGVKPGERGRTHTNSIFVQDSKAGVQRTPEQVEASRVHESIHCLQDQLPAMYCSPFNEATPVVMSVEDWVWRMVMTEGDAYAKSAWLGYLASEENPEIRAAMQSHPVTVEDFELCLKSVDGDVRAALQQASTMWWYKTKDKGAGEDAEVSLLDHYVGHALWLYDFSERFDEKKGHRPEEFVYLDRARVGLDIGRAFGPSTFGEGRIDPNFVYMPPMSPSHQEWMERLRQKTGQPERSSLRSFDDALAARRITPEELVRTSHENLSWLVVKDKSPPAPDIGEAEKRETGPVEAHPMQLAIA